MKILHINTEKTWRGGEQQILYLVNGLKKRGHDSIIVCQPDSPLYEKLRKDDFTVIPLRMLGGIDFLAAKTIAKQLSKGYDILHLHTANAHTLGALATIPFRNQRIVVSRRVSFPIKGFFRRIKYWRVNKVIAVSEDIKKSLIASGISHHLIITIHSAIDLNRFSRISNEPSEPIVGIFAHLAEHKGHRYFLEAAKEVLSTMHDVKFLVVGEGEKRMELENLSKWLGINNKVSFLGFQEDIPGLMSGCTVTVLSSINGEGSPGVLKESMAVGVPVVTTDVGGSSEIVEDGVNGFVVPPEDPHALATAMIKILTDNNLRKKMKLEGLKKVREFSVDIMVEKTESLYKSLLPK